jgi:pimeloyl-ACP methyl ester carboxylesterase
VPEPTHVPYGQHRLAPERVPSSGLTLALHELASAAGPDAEPVLLVHATGLHGRVWAPCAAHLPFRAMAPDVRGHGDSPLPPAAFTPDGLRGPNADADPDPAWLSWDRVADDVLAAADALTTVGSAAAAAGGLLAVGHSMGGAALLLAEQRRPGTFRALYLYEPVVFPPGMLAGRTENPLAEGARRRRRRFDSYDAAIANYAAKPPLSVLDPAALAAYVHHGFAPGDDGTVELVCTPEVEATVFEQGMRHAAFAHLGEVGCPVTVAAGDTDAGPAMAAPFVVEALPRAELVIHAGLGHFGPLQAPAAVAADIAARLACVT